MSAEVSRLADLVADIDRAAVELAAQTAAVEDAWTTYERAVVDELEAKIQYRRALARYENNRRQAIR